MQDDKKEKGLKSHTVVFMICVALFIDFLQFLLGFLYMGWLVGIFAGLTFWLWFRLNGVNIGFSKPWRIIGFASTSLVEMIPIPLLAGLPAWTAFVTTLALKNKLQEVIPGADITKLDIMKR